MADESYRAPLKLGDDTFYFVQGGRAIRIEKSAVIVSVPEDLVGEGYVPSIKQVDEWIDDPTSGTQAMTVVDLLADEDL